MTADSPEEAQGPLAWLLRRRWAMTAVRENARLLLARLEHVGRGADRAAARRAVADGTVQLPGEQLLTAWLHVHGVPLAGSAGVLSEGAACDLLAKMQTLNGLHGDESRN